MGVDTSLLARGKGITPRTSFFVFFSFNEYVRDIRT